MGSHFVVIVGGRRTSVADLAELVVMPGPGVPFFAVATSDDLKQYWAKLNHNGLIEKNSAEILLAEKAHEIASARVRSSLSVVAGHSPPVCATGLVPPLQCEEADSSATALLSAMKCEEASPCQDSGFRASEPVDPTVLKLTSLGEEG